MANHYTTDEQTVEYDLCNKPIFVNKKYNLSKIWIKKFIGEIWLNLKIEKLENSHSHHNHFLNQFWRIKYNLN